MLTGKEESSQETFMFFSFLQKSRDGRRKPHSLIKNDVIEISDGEDDNDVEASDLELLYQAEFDADKPFPMPIEQKPTCKIESPDSAPSQHCQDQSYLSEYEDELIPLCKMEVDYDLRSEGVLGTPKAGNNFILFVCPQCGNNFDDNCQWREHITSAHNFHNHQTFNFGQKSNNEFKCKTCEVVITRCTLKTLQLHFFTHLPYKVYKCKLCRYEARSLYIMISHIMLHKDREELGVAVLTPAKQKSAEAVTLENVALEQESRQIIAYVCPACEENFNEEDAWQAHMNFRHNFLEKTAENRFEDHFKCKECGVEIFSQHVSDLQQHLFTHLPFKSFLKCKLCDFTSSRRNFMLSHILNLHKNHLSTAAAVCKASAEVPREVAITTNSESFSYDSDDNNSNRGNSKRILDNALMQTPAVNNLITTREVQLERDIVANSLTSNHTLLARGFSCKGCDQRFETTAERNKHAVKEHPKFKCDQCAETFSFKMNYTRHSCDKVANNVPMQCDMCFKEYNYEKCFRNHVRRCRGKTARNRINNDNNATI